MMFQLRCGFCATVAIALALAAGSSNARAKPDSMTDANICNAVENSFFLDKAVPYDRIDSTCANGIVTLTGETNNALARKRAARLAETVKGVRAIVNRIKVEPASERSENEIKADVTAALLSDPAADSYEIDVDIDDQGHVTLSGSVDSWQEKRLATKVAACVRGVTGITNNIDIDYATQRPDHEIQPEVQKALEWDALVDHTLVDVEVEDGTVKLSGTVGSAAEKRQARYDAWVAGVTEVDDSKLKVRNWAREPDKRKTDHPVRSADAIRSAIEDANLYDPRVMAFDITPEVTGSVVTLRGTVDNLKAQRAAAENARNTVGVSHVVNRIKVRPVVDRPDDQIARAVDDALARDPYVERYEVDVNVVDGTVYLTGAVDSYFEKAQAEDAASRVNGVVDVSNALVVADVNGPIVHDPYVYDWHIYDHDWYDYEPGYTVKPDVSIKEAIENELWWSPYVDADQVTVTVADGVATLTGTVDTWTERRAAAENALEGGAVAVNNRLDVRTES